jgi:hypothetical protein
MSDFNDIDLSHLASIPNLVDGFQGVWRNGLSVPLLTGIRLNSSSLFLRAVPLFSLGSSL